MRKHRGVRWPSYGAALLAGTALLAFSGSGVVYARGTTTTHGTGGSSGHSRKKNGVLNYLNPPGSQEARRITRQDLQKGGGGTIGYGSNHSRSFHVSACGGGRWALNRAGVAAAQLETSNGTCPKPGTSHTVQIPPPLLYQTRTVTWKATGPLYFNGCQTQPPQQTVINDWVPNTSGQGTSRGYWTMRLAAHEPTGVIVQAPQKQIVQMGATQEPTLKPGEVVPASGALAPSASFWNSMVQEQATSPNTIEGGINTMLLPGPMWAVWSQSQQEYATQYHYAWVGQWVETGSTTVKVGRPVWHAGEAYNINSCPVPVVQITPTSQLP